ncbi:DUF3034 family protein [Inhella gelatinilytica]|uniref:DUF3034 family protein n=1 Tax=Inhella gelatinilytica TaxID=2795030 RepID=A0A931J005_9BURK|nr:DUF3034 family protein [Inhella gelatinilytica]MBH9553058.1 DUF3034 family protein [Inhella gelatinilytica]
MKPTILSLLTLTLLSAAAHAADGKLLLTGGVSTIDGAAGGGLSPWALTGTYASEGQWGASAFVTHLRAPDYRLTVAGAALAWDERLELSLARQRLDTRQNLAPLGLGGLQLRQDIVGVKWRFAGEAILDADRWMPQLALGALHKRAHAGAFAPTLFGPLGARRSDTELYLAATKLWLAQSLLTNVTLRASRANQNGLLGFGGAQDRRWEVRPEVSAALLLAPEWALGFEARAKPNKLERSVLGDGALRERDWFDVFVAYAPNKRASLTAAWVDVGAIAPALNPKRQRGAYLSLQLSH